MLFFSAVVAVVKGRDHTGQSAKKGDQQNNDNGRNFKCFFPNGVIKSILHNDSDLLHFTFPLSEASTLLTKISWSDGSLTSYFNG